MKPERILGAVCVVLACGLAPGAQQEKTLFCSPQGKDAAGRGSREEPLKTVDAALGRIGPAGGGTVVLLDGEYRHPRSVWAFQRPVIIRAETRRKASMRRLYLHGAKHLVFDGLVFDRKSAGRAVNVVHLDGRTSYCTIRNCVITHGAGGHQNTDALKINQGSHHILIEENEIFDGTDEEIDILQDIHDVVVRRNLVYQWRIKEKPEALVSNKRRARRVVYDGNLFANLNPDSSNGALRFGGSQRGGDECRALIAVGNLFVNTTGRGAMTFAGARACLVADNVFVNHDDRRTGAVTIYTNYPRDAIANDGLFVVHNLFYNVTGPRRRPVFSFPPKDQAAFPRKYHISHNLYHNPGGPVPRRGEHNPHAETGAVFKDPLFAGDPAKLKGQPTAAWRDVLSLKPESPFLVNAVDLVKLALPRELREFLEDYRTGKRDPWYRTIKARRPGK
jgi:hypothetical protein